MSAGASPEQMERARRKWLNQIRQAALKSQVSVVPASGRRELCVYVDNYSFTFDMSFSNASNGETFGKGVVVVTSKITGNSQTFNYYSWTGDAANHSLAEFWRALVRDPSSFRSEDLIDAFQMRETVSV